MQSFIPDLARLFTTEPSQWNLAESLDESSPPVDLSSDVSQPPFEPRSPAVVPDAYQDGMLKAKTRFLLARPPANRSKHQLSTRPRMILQLQHVRDSSRPLPAFDVVLTKNMASRLMPRASKVMKEETVACGATLTITRSDTYGSDSDAEVDVANTLGDETTHPGGIVGKIHYVKYANDDCIPKDEIVLRNGMIWEASRLKTGVYEFSGKNHDGLKLRWVSRPDVKSQARSGTSRQSSQKTKNSRFIFSIINPTTRQHPVIATLTKANELNILDRFPSMVLSTKPPPSSSNPHSPLSSDFSFKDSFSDTQAEGISSYIETDENLRLLIILTAVWVMSRERWPMTFSDIPSEPHRVPQSYANRSPSPVVSSTDNWLKVPSPNIKRPFDLRRSSTSRSAQHKGHNQPVSLQRANSVDPTWSRNDMASIFESSERPTAQTLPSPCERPEGNGHPHSSNHSRVGSMPEKTSVDRFDGGGRDHPDVPRWQCIAYRRVSTTAAGSAQNDNSISDLVWEGRKPGKEMSDGEQARHHAKKWSGGFRAIYRSLAAYRAHRT